MSTQSVSVSQVELADRLSKLRARMQEKGANWCLVRATDSYLNEYVPLDQSRRVYITGFTGSVGDALIGLKEAFLFVDGRYALQATEQAVHFDVTVLALGVSIESACMDAMSQYAKGGAVLIEEDRVTKNQFDRILEVAGKVGFSLLADIGLIDQIKYEGHPRETQQLSPVWAVDEKILGSSLSDRLSLVKTTLEKKNIDGFLLVALDDIAWISGFRGSDFAYQSTFAARGIVFTKALWVSTPHSTEFSSAPGIRGFQDWEQTLNAIENPREIRIGYDPDSTPYALYKQLNERGVHLTAVMNPVQDLKSRKCKAEIDHMYSAFAKADQVVFDTQNWVCDQVMSGARITEADVDKYVRARFEDSGTVGLSFTPICGYAKNGAVIHHSIPDSKTPIEEGELFLLDTGGIYEGGYATDLTRTFLVGGPNSKATDAHKQMYTLVLKGAIAGMSARMPEGFTGVQLDALVRAPFWQLGLNFAHGTGHGIGINVHEFPPRVATFGTAKIEIGHVFSIEPGLYIPQFGGVRIENLCTVIKDEEKSGFLRVLPITFAPLDERLIEDELLTNYERSFLTFYRNRFETKEKDWSTLPPLDEQYLALMAVLSNNRK